MPQRSLSSCRLFAPLAATTLAASGCSLILDLDARTCVSNSECEADDICVAGVCEPPAIGDDETSVGQGTGTGTGISRLTGTAGNPEITSTSSAWTSTTEAEADTTAIADDATTTGNDTTTGDEGTQTTSTDTTSTTTSTSDDEGTTTSTDDGDSSTTEEPPIVELFLNETFEEGINGWSGFGAFVEVSDAQAHSGEQSALCYYRDAEWNGVQAILTGRLVPGVQYQVSAWLRLNTETEEYASMRMTRRLACQGDTTTYTPIGYANVTSDAWTQIQGVLSVPSSCTPVEIALYFEGAAVGVDPDIEYLEFFLDDVEASPP